MNSKLSTDKVLITVIILLMLTISIVIAVSFFQSKKVDETAKMISHTQEVLIHSEKILALSTDNETGSRGYILTGQRSFLEPLQRSQREIYTEIAKLKELTADNVIQVPRTDSLLFYIDKKINYTNNLVSIYDAKGAAAATAVVETGEGKYYGDQVRLLVNKIQATENALLAQRRESNESKTNSLNSIFLSIVVSILVLLGLFIQKIRLDLIERKKTALALENMNNELEQRVVERTTELEKSRDKLEETFLRITDAFIALDKDWNYTYLNKKAGELIQRQPESLVGKNVWKEFPEAVGSATYQILHMAMKEQRYMWNEDYFAPLDLWQENHVYPSPDGVSLYIRDISERKKSESKVYKANRLYFFISQINQMIVRTRDEKTLFHEACQIAVNLGKFKLAWIGKLDKDDALSVVEWAGEKQDYLFDNIIKAVAIAPERKSGTGAILLAGKHVICNDIEKDPEINHWHAAAIENDYHSYMILPLKKFGKTVGVFTFYAGEKNYFDRAEIALLEEATGDVSFALENFEREALRTQAEEATLKEKQLSDSIINTLPGVFYLYNKEGKFYRWNKNFETVTGYSGEEIAQMHPLHFFDEDEKELLIEKIGNVFVTGEDSVQANFLIRSKQKIPYFFTGKAITYEGEECLMGVGIDFSELVRAQEEIKQATEKLHQLTAHLQSVREEERKRIGREIHDELGQQLTAIKMDASWLEKKIAPDADILRNKLRNIIQLLDGSNQAIRRILSELRPSILDDQGLLEALTWLSKQFTDNTGIPVDFITSENKLRLPEPITTCVFRLYQEALTNVTKYSEATKVTTRVSLEDGLLNFSVEDDGKGFDVTAVQSKRSFGILGMRERVLSVNGDFRLIAAVGKGTKIAVQIPVKNQAI
ncbi:MAG: CHASE3 domain-containing protein [Ferruginibacter sp.]